MRTCRTAAGLVRRTKNLGVKANVCRKTVAQARERLVTITDDVSLVQPAILLASGSDLMIVCDSAGILAGVVTKTDVVSQICHCHGGLHNSNFIGDDTRRCSRSALRRTASSSMDPSANRYTTHRGGKQFPSARESPKTCILRTRKSPAKAGLSLPPHAFIVCAGEARGPERAPEPGSTTDWQGRCEQAHSCRWSAPHCF
jgi:hypothetical protein